MKQLRKYLVKLLDAPGVVTQMPSVPSKNYFSFPQEMRNEFNAIVAQQLDNEPVEDALNTTVATTFSSQSVFDLLDRKKVDDETIFDDAVKTTLNATIFFLDNHDYSHLHVFMALHQLLEIFIFSPLIKAQLEKSKSEALADIQVLHYFLESANDESVHRTLNEAKGNENLRHMILQGEKNPIIFELTLLNCLSHMSDTTYNTLMSGVKKVERVDRIAEVVGNLTCSPRVGEKSLPSTVANSIRFSLAALVATEIYRIPAQYKITDKKFDAELHARKNFKSILTQNALQKHYIDFLRENPPISEASTETPEGDINDIPLVLTNNKPEEKMNASQTFALLGVMLHQPVMVGEYWNDFLSNITSTNENLVTLMTSALIKNADLLPLQQWFEVLEEYCLDEKNVLSSQDRFGDAYNNYKKLYELLDPVVEGFSDLYGINFDKITICFNSSGVYGKRNPGLLFSSGSPSNKAPGVIAGNTHK